MQNFYKERLEGLEETINQLSIEFDDPIKLAEDVIETTVMELNKLKIFVQEKGFKDVEEEINFFKNLKPKILSKLIYYNAIYKIETKRPFGGKKVVRKYLKRELAKLKRYFDNNLDFYKYYRTSSTHLDHKYFVRGKYDIKLCLDSFYFETDHNFSTSHDFKVAKIISNDLIEVYLEDQIFKTKQKGPVLVPVSLNWTGSKTALIELIYSLHSQAVFDNGTAEIKLLAKYFESIFNIDLGDFYHTYLEIKNRKINRTKFLDALRDSLIKKMDEQDER